TGAKVTSLRGGTVAFEHGGRSESRQFDAIVNAVGSRSVRKIADAIDKSGIPFTVIGDSVKPAQIDKAIHDAFMAVMNLK
ncbi:MAG TPA: NADH:flavin oxidoreductase, partial [Spirochaetota bacterium]|nr:NADH:flavin oxidoreductase [Spirochaetota bacterium]